MNAARRLTLYMKPGCHLCDDLRTAIDELNDDGAFEVEEVDITRDAALFERYRYEIPVLVEGGTEIGRGRMSEADLAMALGRIRRAQPRADTRGRGRG